MLGNLTHNTGRALLDGAGDHGRCCGSYLTGIQVKKSTVDIKAGVSWIRLSPTRSAAQTRFPSLEIGLEDARQSGDCDSGYSCAYTNNLAWRSETQPLPPILDPRALFERLFGNGVVLSPEARVREAQVPPQHSGFRHRRHQEARNRASVPRTAASSTSISPPSAKSNGSSKRRRRTTRRSIRTWRSPTACRPISPSISS